MRLTDTQISDYHSYGFVAAPEVFTREEIRVLSSGLDAFIDDKRPEVHMQRRGSEAPRLIYAADRYSEAFRRLSLHPRWIQTIARQRSLHSSTANQSKSTV